MFVVNYIFLIQIYLYHTVGYVTTSTHCFQGRYLAKVRRLLSAFLLLAVKLLMLQYIASVLLLTSCYITSVTYSYLLSYFFLDNQVIICWDAHGMHLMSFLLNLHDYSTCDLMCSIPGELAAALP
jgi:hypothetical protein